MYNKLLTITLLLILSLISLSYADNNTKTSNLTVFQTIEPVPPDLKEYEIKCQPDDSLATKFGVNATEEEIDDTGKKTQKWTGNVLTTIGVFACQMRAFDQAGQSSEQSDPYIVDTPPDKPTLIKIIINKK